MEFPSAIDAIINWKEQEILQWVGHSPKDYFFLAEAYMKPDPVILLLR